MRKVLFTMMCVCLTSLFAFSQTGVTVLNPTQDARVESNNGDGNFGDESYLMVRNSSWDRQSFLDFDLSGLDKDKPIESAYLRLVVSDFEHDGIDSFNLLGNLIDLSDEWSEMDITYNTKPGASLSINQMHFNSADIDVGDEILLEVTPMLRKLLDSNSVGIHLYSDESAFLSFHSREAEDVSVRPQLIVKQDALGGRFESRVAFQDTYLPGGTDEVNGDALELEVKHRDGTNSQYYKEGYVKFDVKDVLVFDKVYLTLTSRTDQQGSFELALYDVPHGSWDAATSTYNNTDRLVHADSVKLVSLGETPNMQLFRWDITDIVDSLKNVEGLDTISFGLLGGDYGPNGNDGTNFTIQSTNNIGVTGTTLEFINSSDNVILDTLYTEDDRPLAPAFDNATKVYVDTVLSRITEVPGFVAVAQSAYATVAFEMAADFSDTTKIWVVAEDGTVSDTFRIAYYELPANNDATLDTLYTLDATPLYQINDTAFVDTLAPETVEVPGLVAIASDTIAEVVIDTAATANDVATITVTAEDGTQKVYTVAYYLISNNADLATLTVDEGVLTPAFSADITSYTDTLPEGSTEMPAIDFTTDSDKATVELDSATDVTSADLADRTATITVTAEDGTEKVYTIEFLVASSATSVDALIAAGIAVYPNPVASVLSVDGAEGELITVLDMTGAVVATSNTAQVDLSALPAGQYFVVVAGETFKVIKK